MNSCAHPGIPRLRTVTYISGKTVLLLFQRDPVVSENKFVIVTCSTCGFIGSTTSI